ncbi:uncharacterized protein LOC128994365 [Macrosteles quadrilineatus]|uniref:uncharacterized protein LOC128986593 n=1 Tax=Macrosteles quadrilineatus TaxID=74068 RepID=UPI0023E20011|nr:uncharacterized protein LOC128986593 [Macrosteles quadrilineatus]XP_054263008.1 uncharacterized protein LOC128986593 [Macrosteles quadrilineatus]XP_054274869.1 uncharacterized protein LOC128994365 [Macrosteles quadrilineatus]XP_054274870.1 uncharacterized protein LOC128994365 [Macrosteles quadrilineatus]
MGGMRWILGTGRTGVIVIVIQELRFWILIQLRNWPIKWARLKTHQENYWNLHKNWASLNLNGYLLHQMRRWMHPPSEGAERNTNYRPLYSVKELKEEHLVR